MKADKHDTEAAMRWGTGREGHTGCCFSSPFSCSPPPSPPLWNELLFSFSFFLTITHWDEGGRPAACACQWYGCLRGTPLPISAWAWCVSMSGCSCERLCWGGGGDESPGGGREETGGDCLTWSVSSHIPCPPSPPASIHPLHFSLSASTVDLSWLPLPVVHFKGNYDMWVCFKCLGKNQNKCCLCNCFPSWLFCQWLHLPSCCSSSSLFLLYMRSSPYTFFRFFCFITRVSFCFSTPLIRLSFNSDDDSEAGRAAAHEEHAVTHSHAQRGDCTCRTIWLISQGAEVVPWVTVEVAMGTQATPLSLSLLQGLWDHNTCICFVLFLVHNTDLVPS